MATVDSSQRPSVGSASQKDLIPITRTILQAATDSRERVSDGGGLLLLAVHQPPGDPGGVHGHVAQQRRPAWPSPRPTASGSCVEQHQVAARAGRDGALAVDGGGERLPRA